MQILAAQGLKAQVESTFEDIKTCGSKEEYDRMFTLASQYAMLKADMLQQELAKDLGEEAARRMVDYAKQKVMYA